MSAQEVREAIALAIFREEMEDPTAEFQTEEQWRSRLSVFDTTPNPREEYLPLADAVLRALGDRLAPPSALEGATSPGEPLAYPATPGEFASRWNRWSEERRATWLAGRVTASEVATRCWEQNHAGDLEHLARLLSRRPAVVCICGSTRFKADMLDAARDETLAGRVVVMPGVFGHADGMALTEEVKTGLDALHLRKIDVADEVLVVTREGYVGESTSREIDYAKRHGKPVVFWPRQGRDEEQGSRQGP